MKEKGMKVYFKWTPAALGALARGDIKNFVVASTPGGIEAQEAAGQKDFVAKSTLPKEMTNVTRKQLKAIGFVFGNDVDDLFVEVTMPNGWKKQPTEHSMWSDLLDDKGRKRAAIFYKAAFYDRSASLYLTNRYVCQTQPEDFYKNKDMTYEERKQGRWACVVLDGEEIVFQTEWATHKDTERYYNEDDEMRDIAKAWLAEHYPDYENPMAYWD